MDQLGFWIKPRTSAAGQTACYRTAPPLAATNSEIAGSRFQVGSVFGRQGIPLPKRRRHDPVSYADGGGKLDAAVSLARIPGNQRNVRHRRGLYCPDAARF